MGELDETGAASGSGLNVAGVARQAGRVIVARYLSRRGDRSHTGRIWKPI